MCVCVYVCVYVKYIMHILFKNKIWIGFIIKKTS